MSSRTRATFAWRDRLSSALSISWTAVRVRECLKSSLWGEPFVRIHAERRAWSALPTWASEPFSGEMRAITLAENLGSTAESACRT